MTFSGLPYMVTLTVNGRVAQLVEHLTFNQVAPGSSPGTLTINKKGRLKNRPFLRFFPFRPFRIVRRKIVLYFLRKWDIAGYTGI